MCLLMQVKVRKVENVVQERRLGEMRRSDLARPGGWPLPLGAVRVTSPWRWSLRPLPGPGVGEMAC